VKSGVISINAAAAVSSLSTEDQVAAAAAGKDELKQAAKRVRDAKRKPRETGTEWSEQATDDAADAESTSDDINALRKRVAALEAENATLRKQVLNLLEKRGP
jgi:polyhydroxyalkanoate synthesis regulator phasin